MSDTSKKEGIVINIEGNDVPLGKKEMWESMPGVVEEQDYPDPIRHFELCVEKPNHNIEETYYWYFHQVQTDWSYKMEKIIDTYAASQASSHFGHMQSRISVQQNQISQYLKGISEMLKGLFQMVRELRIIDDRLQFYMDSVDQNSGNKDSSEIVLKGLWVDQVEGGAKNPGSVYGLSTNVGFTILPDLFFRMRIIDPKNIDKKVDELKFNEKIKEILKRKLRQYQEWKTRTFDELRTRRKFMIKYVRQHHDTIKLYISWIKPYLRYSRQMQQAKRLEENDELISSFESTIVEIEFLAKRKIAGNHYSVGVVNLLHRTRPELNFHAQEYQHKGPIHTGKTMINIRTYAWTQKEIDAYKKFKEEEDLVLMSSIDESVNAAMDALGDELKNYLEEKGEKMTKDEPKKKKTNSLKVPSVLDPFISIFKGFAEIGTGFFPKMPAGLEKSKKVNKHVEYSTGLNKDAAKKEAIKLAYLLFKNYKKGQGMMTPW
jgi:hypothetical protein